MFDLTSIASQLQPSLRRHRLTRMPKARPRKTRPTRRFQSKFEPIAIARGQVLGSACIDSDTSQLRPSLRRTG